MLKQVTDVSGYAASLGVAAAAILAFVLFAYLIRRSRNTELDDEGKAGLRLVKLDSFSADDSANIVSRPLLNQGEKRFMGMLLQALPECFVFVQVSFNALVTHSPKIDQRHWQRLVRRQFNTKYVDFVLCDKCDMRVIAVVEFDGSGHSKKSDQLRDKILEQAGYRIERFNGTATVEVVRTRFGVTPPVEKSGQW
jgi:hypothetical protein